MWLARTRLIAQDSRINSVVELYLRLIRSLTFFLGWRILSLITGRVEHLTIHVGPMKLFCTVASGDLLTPPAPGQRGHTGFMQVNSFGTFKM